MENNTTPKPKFDYDPDPDLRALEQQLERPALLQKVAAAQAAARLRRRRGNLFLAALLAAALVSGWWICQRLKNLAAPPETEQKGTPPSDPPQNPTSEPTKNDTVPTEQKLENLPPKNPGGFPDPKKSAPSVVIAFAENERDFSTEFRGIVGALKTGRLPEAEKQLAALEKSLPPEDEVRALDEDEEARLDTLAYLKGLTMLRLQRFSAAATAFSRLDETGKPWHQEAQFYLFQAYFFLNEQRRAEAVLAKMRRIPGHRFLKKAEDWAAGNGHQ